MRVTQVIPTFRMFDERKAREFYVDFLGCTIDFEARFAEHAPLYMQVSRDGLVLHLSEHHGDGTPGSHAFAWIEGLDGIHEELKAKNYKYLHPGIQDQPWGRSMTLIDPFNNKIILNEQYPDEK